MPGPPTLSLPPALGLDFAGIILGTHHEKGAFTFWSYAIGLPLPSSSILSWKFCHVLHKVLRDGHPNVSRRCPRGSPVSVPKPLGGSLGLLSVPPEQASTPGEQSSVPLKWETVPPYLLPSPCRKRVGLPLPVLGSSPASPLPVLQVLHDCQRYRSNIREIGELWVGARGELGSLSPHRQDIHRLRPWACLVLEPPALWPSNGSALQQCLSQSRS